MNRANLPDSVRNAITALKGWEAFVNKNGTLDARPISPSAKKDFYRAPIRILEAILVAEDARLSADEINVLLREDT